MNPELDKQNRRNPWPWSLDTPLDRARKVAGMYRTRLKALAPAACAEADDVAVSFGEDWMVEKPDIVDPEDELTTAEAAALVRVSVRRIRDWAQAAHPERPDEPLLPRFKMRGKERTYLAVHVLAAAAARRRERHADLDS